MSTKPTNTYMSCLILSQNGVANGPTRNSPELHVPQVDISSTVESPYSIQEPLGSFLKRPSMLRVNQSNGYAGKSLPGSGHVADGGSLASTPDQSSDGEADVSGDQVLDHDTKELIGCFLRDFTGLSEHRWFENKALATMKRVVEDVLSKHRYAYNGMIKKVSLDHKPDDVRFISDVAGSLFSDGVTNWGRIASLVAFGAAVCQNQKERGREHCVDLVGQEISTYLLKHQREWLTKNKSWDGFVEFFKVADPESAVRKSLMAFVGVAGIGATLAFLIR